MRIAFAIHQGLGGLFQGGSLDEMFGLLLMGQQRLDFTQQRLVSCASRLQKRGPLTLFAFQGRVAELLDFIPASRLHCVLHHRTSLATTTASPGASRV